MPTIFTDSKKFDRTNWPTWSDNIRTVAKLKGSIGYLDGTIKDPTPNTTTTTTTTQTISASPLLETPWNSPNPSPDEWISQDAWTKALLTFNTKNPIGLGINTKGTAAEAWESYIAGYEATSDIVRQNAEQELRNLTYSNDNDFPTHLTIMRNKLAHARALGADISDKNFKTIILNSLPRTWDPVVAALYRDIPNSKAFFQLYTWWLRISCDRPIKTSHSVTTLQANSNMQNRKLLICANPNCKCRGHTIEACY